MDKNAKKKKRNGKADGYLKTTDKKQMSNKEKRWAATGKNKQQRKKVQKIGKTRRKSLTTFDKENRSLYV